MRLLCMWTLVCLWSIFGVNGGIASPITFVFTGSVTDDPFTLSTFGAPISGSYTFDSAATDAIPGPSTGSFASIGPQFGFLVNVDGTPYSVSGSLIVNTANNIGVDQYGALATDGALTLEVFLQDATQSALSSDALPLLPPLLSAFDVGQFRLFSADAEFLGSVDSLACSAGCGDPANTVPEPASIPLLLTAILLVACVARHHRKRRATCNS